MLLPVLFGLSSLAQVLGTIRRRRRFERHGIHVVGAVIDHVVTDTQGQMLVQFDDEQGNRITFTSERRTQLDPVSAHVDVVCLPQEPSHARLLATTSVSTQAVLRQVLLAVLIVIGAIMISFAMSYGSHPHA